MYTFSQFLFLKLLFHFYGRARTAFFLCLQCCLQWDNVSISHWCSQAWPKEQPCRLSWRPSAAWNKCVNHCLQCISSFKTLLSHSRLWFNILVSVLRQLLHWRCLAGFPPSIMQLGEMFLSELLSHRHSLCICLRRQPFSESRRATEMLYVVSGIEQLIANND